jgi:hypothetical protein
MLRSFPVLLLLAVLAFPVAAQDADLAVDDITLESRVDVYGLENTVATGTLTNNSAQAQTSITLFAEAYDAGDTLVGEGIGYLVNQCGAGLLPDFALQPAHTQPFEVVIELFSDDAVVDRVDVTAQASAIDPAAPAAPIPGITQASDMEVVDVEWLDTRALRYAVGCSRDLFTEQQWMQYSARTGTTLPVVHPRADDITQTLIDRMNVLEPGVIDESMLHFAPVGTRLVYQGEINRFYTSEADGTFQRVIYDDLYNRTLQGIQWVGGDIFLAYYFGASTDPVYYFTASATGQPISLHPNNLPLSQIVPGVSPDGRRAIIAGTFNDETGYFLESLVNNAAPQLLFEATPPGNNWPAPLFHIIPREESGVAQERVYIARPVDGVSMLQCYSLQEGGPVDMTPLPINLGLDERAQWWLSPDGATLALAANGVNGGLWLIDIASMGDCEA